VFVGQLDFKTNVIIASLICVLMAVIFDLLLVLFQSLMTPWRSPGKKRPGRGGRFFDVFRRTATQ
jgi:osmoprotectant transport system permease protein